MKKVLYGFTGFLSHPYTLITSATMLAMCATTGVGSMVVMYG